MVENLSEAQQHLETYANDKNVSQDIPTANMQRKLRKLVKDYLIKYLL